jgi:hypothetical protein
MAKCDEGYLCEVCGSEVESIVDSDLYLRYVIGLLDPETLHTSSERHLRCNPQLAQFICDPNFERVVVDGDFGSSALDPAFVREREALATRGFQRLREIADLLTRQELSILEYPLPEVREAMEKG